MKRIFGSKIMMVAIGFFAGVALADTVKPMLAKIPVVGAWFAPKV